MVLIAAWKCVETWCNNGCDNGAVSCSTTAWVYGACDCAGAGFPANGANVDDCGAAANGGCAHAAAAAEYDGNDDVDDKGDLAM